MNNQEKLFIAKQAVRGGWPMPSPPSPEANATQAITIPGPQPGEPPIPPPGTRQNPPSFLRPKPQVPSKSSYGPDWMNKVQIGPGGPHNTPAPVTPPAPQPAPVTPPAPQPAPPPSNIKPPILAPGGTEADIWKLVPKNAPRLPNNYDPRAPRGGWSLTEGGKLLPPSTMRR